MYFCSIGCGADAAHVLRGEGTVEMRKFSFHKSSAQVHKCTVQCEVPAAAHLSPVCSVDIKCSTLLIIFNTMAKEDLKHLELTRVKKTKQQFEG